MSFPAKIMTCCHCGLHAALASDTERHSLKCEGCGAPLSILKAMPVKRQVHKVDHRSAKQPKRAKVQPHQIRTSFKKSKKKKRKGLFKRFAEEAFDFVEDIFD